MKPGQKGPPHSRSRASFFVPGGISMDNEARRGLGYAGVPGVTSKWNKLKGDEVSRERPPGSVIQAMLRPVSAKTPPAESPRRPREAFF